MGGGTMCKAVITVNYILQQLTIYIIYIYIAAHYIIYILYQLTITIY